MTIRQLHTIWNWFNLATLLGLALGMATASIKIDAGVGGLLALGIFGCAVMSWTLMVIIESMNKTVIHGVLTGIVALMPLVYLLAWFSMQASLAKRHAAVGLPTGAFAWPPAKGAA